MPSAEKASTVQAWNSQTDSSESVAEGTEKRERGEVRFAQAGIAASVPNT